MLKTSLALQNSSCESIHYVNDQSGVDCAIAPYSSTTIVVTADRAFAVAQAIHAKFPAVAASIVDTFEDGEDYPYQPFVKCNLSGDGAPGSSDDITSGYTVGSVWIDVTNKAIYQCTANTEDAAEWKNLTDQPIASKTPVNAVAATGTITSDATAPADDDTVTIDGVTYTFKSTLTPAEGEVLIGVSAAVALDNLKAAINHEGTPDTDYSCEAAHPTVTATTNTNTTQVVVAKVKGVAGNSIATAETSEHLAWGAATLSGGVNGTTGSARELCSDASYLYHCVAANTIADANWRRIALGSAY